ncbi:MAG TPA: aspartyl protease family protein [Bryobacteraceae bacterium]|nr:aspartyl protease family protein [Bryobacteraceae bacterium]
MTRLATLLLMIIAARAADDPFKAAYDAHHWPDLRDAVLANRNAPAFYRLVIAQASNDVRGAEKALKELERSGAPKETLSDAHYLLNRMFTRIGDYQNALAHAKRIAEVMPDRAISAAALEDEQTLARLPKQEVISRRPGTVAYSKWPDAPYVVCPVNINGQAVRFALDTGATASSMTESLAKRLDLRTVGGHSRFEGYTGTHTATMHYAYAERLKIGNSELRNVAFLVMPDDLDVLAGVPPDERGIIGMPVFLALETMRWNREGQASFAFPAARFDARHANLLFDGLQPVTFVEIGGHKLGMELDSGSETTFLWPMFVKDYPQLLIEPQEGKRNLYGATGSAELRALTLREIKMTVGGLPIVYKNAPALLQSTVSVSQWLYGLMGKDQLDQASEVTFDFRAMKLELK